MADVTVPERWTPNEGRPDRERGQLVLLSGLLLATSLVALVLILNSAIYTENLATRNDGVPATDAIEYRENARQGAAGAIEHVNRHARSRNKGPIGRRSTNPSSPGPIVAFSTSRSTVARRT